MLELLTPIGAVIGAAGLAAAGVIKAWNIGKEHANQRVLGQRDEARVEAGRLRRRLNAVLSALGRANAKLANAGMESEQIPIEDDHP